MRRRGFAIVIVLVAVALAAAALLSLRASAFRQATAGREAVAELRAKWAARAGLEAAIATLAFNTESPNEGVAYATIDDLAEVSSYVFRDASYEMAHVDGNVVREGPADAHSKINVNRMGLEDLLELTGMTEDVAGAIIDWVDEDDEVSEFGVEAGYYSQLASPYEPRNGLLRSLEELELVAGVDPELLRGEDWNLNGRLDPNEDDGDASPPADDADGRLDAGWSAIITTESLDEGLGFSGEPRIYLPEADDRTLIGRIGALTPLQAQAIIEHSGNPNASTLDFIATPLRALAQGTGAFSPAELQLIENLDADQVTQLVDETTMTSPEDGPVPGRVNLNLVRREILDYIQPLRDAPGVADLLITLRNERPQGFVHITDLLDYMPPQQLVALAPFIDVQSNAYVVTSVGRDTSTGIEVEIRATIERSALPIVITEMVVR